MNSTTKLLASTVIALASAMAGNAFAQSTDHVYPEMSATSSTVTRAQVQSELAQAKQNGMAFTQANDHSYPFAAMNDGAGKSRAEVQSELRMQSKNGVNVPYDHS
ncbi:hypothetical protein RCH06_000528 [Polaromonas sp. CG_9.5]|uniref:DUF4148 domain-containing protein n=1 Tax=Polaromonas sp. CG_9.5 TaxID=3071705 RepID=UPI002E0CA4BC|nr:hypothetical protein [Polaromonas sp. CG_9.5]